MASFKKVQEMLFLCLIEEIMEEEEFVLLSQENRPSNLPFHAAYEQFSLENKDLGECQADFQVEKRDIPLLTDALRAPSVFQCHNGTAYKGHKRFHALYFSMLRS